MGPDTATCKRCIHEDMISSATWQIRTHVYVCDVVTTTSVFTTITSSKLH